ncbi:hypothetical protein K435DRAFT_796614 [Dendrothele bispora CBS 962.96]|uniref:Uncharacterized protein n=1 Tax=Dendrothele bispora (strain CBS 962.96) TaxID=1314807 RepID=A0A4S8M524_DENBC|nr:hypothetical protein K435DRAFT_796614 [Dendrothele bispora CBS 962.96]
MFKTKDKEMEVAIWMGKWQDWLSASWLSQAHYFRATVNGLYENILESADVCWGSDENDLYYWSFDPDGSCPLSKRVTEALGLPELIPKAQFQLFRGYNPSTQEFAKRHGLPLLDIIWPEGKTGPDEDGDSWYDCQETQYKNNNHLNEPTLPDQFYQFPTPRKIFQELLNKNMCPECHSWPKFSVKPWLHGFLPDHELDTWQGHLIPSYPLKERGYFCWFDCPGAGEVNPERNRSNRRQRNSL